MFGLPIILCLTFFTVVSDGATAAPRPDKSFLHRFCTPCTHFMEKVKNITSSRSLRTNVKRGCSVVLINPFVCGPTIDVLTTYIEWTPAVVMCERLFLCPMEGFFGFGHHDNKG